MGPTCTEHEGWHGEGQKIPLEGKKYWDKNKIIPFQRNDLFHSNRIIIKRKNIIPFERINLFLSQRIIDEREKKSF